MTTLSSEQRRIIERVKNREVSIIHGTAGTGKSTLIAALKRELGPFAAVFSPTHPLRRH